MSAAVVRLEAAKDEIRRRFPHVLLTGRPVLWPVEDEQSPTERTQPDFVGSPFEHLVGWPMERGTCLAMAGRGATSLMWQLMVRVRDELGERIAYVDGTNAFFPPGAAAAGIDVDQLLWLHCPCPRRGLRAVELLTASGLFGLVVYDPPAGQANDIACRRLSLTLMRGSSRVAILERPHVQHSVRIHRRVVVEAAQMQWLNGNARCGAAGWRLWGRPMTGGGKRPEAAVAIDLRARPAADGDVRARPAVVRARPTVDGSSKGRA